MKGLRIFEVFNHILTMELSLGHLEEAVRVDFCSLWEVRQRNKFTYEVSTGLATCNDKFISVFVTQRKQGGFVITDGAYLEEGLYGKYEILATEKYFKPFEFFRMNFGVQQRYFNERNYFYKEVEKGKEHMLTRQIFDLSHFLQAIGNLLAVEDLPRDKGIDKASFTKQLKQLLTQILPEKKVIHNYNYEFGEKRKMKIRFHHKINNTKSFSFIQRIAGSNSYNYENSVSRAYMNYDVLDRVISPQEYSYLKYKIVVVDQEAKGYTKHEDILNFLQKRFKGDKVKLVRFPEERAKLEDIVAEHQH